MSNYEENGNQNHVIYDINTASAEKKSIDWNIIQDTTDKIR